MLEDNYYHLRLTLCQWVSLLWWQTGPHPLPAGPAGQALRATTGQEEGRSYKRWERKNTTATWYHHHADKVQVFAFTCVPNHSAHFVASLEWQLSMTESRSCRNYSTSFRQPFYPLQAANVISLKPTFRNMHQRFVSDPACDHQVDRQSHTRAQQHVLPTHI